MELNRDDHLDVEDFLVLPHLETHKEPAATCSSLKAKPSITLSPVNGSCRDLPSNTLCLDYMLQQNYEGYVVERMEEEDAGKFKVAFRTRSCLEIMDDGYKWRKYGKKKIKNNPNPRHYYRCSREGCKVKKRVEREREDEQFVITTYEGKHNHENPAAATSLPPHRNPLPYH
ncbi:hypothetical protein Gohar_024234 [Gossypium harknessii]|uniref:WRKY domain-containing protein n=1 Tax=Gossypium harknessii TaxID=34285 RepID=A0A7J9HF91_9ROSI|nr:hypothetical protein [Gossypium harknessii]